MNIRLNISAIPKKTDRENYSAIPVLSLCPVNSEFCTEKSCGFFIERDRFNDLPLESIGVCTFAAQIVATEQVNSRAITSLNAFKVPIPHGSRCPISQTACVEKKCARYSTNIMNPERCKFIGQAGYCLALQEARYQLTVIGLMP